MKFSGVFASLPTPFNHRGEIYRVKIAQNVCRWNRAGLAGYLVAGLSGEGSLLSAEEKKQVWEWAAQDARSGALLLAGADAPSVRQTVELSRQAARIGYHAAVIRAPAGLGWRAEPPETALLYFRAVADQAGLPIVIDNTPAASRVSMKAAAELAEHPRIIALIDESPEPLQDLLKGGRKGFAALVGESPNPVSPLISGASGMVTGFAAAAPFFCLNLEEAVRTREHAAARDLEQRARGAIDLLRLCYGIPGLKYALDLNGYYGGPPRLPLAPLRPAAKQKIEAAFHGIGS